MRQLASPVRLALVTGALLLAACAGVHAQTQPSGPEQTPLESAGGRGRSIDDTPDLAAQVKGLSQAGFRLPLAGALACALALRPRRRGTPKRQPSVIQTQIVLAVIGALVMLVVGSSLARAFGIVGAAGLVRYRAKIDDPKDAGVMLSTLSIGLASGVGLWLLAIFGTAFIALVLWIVESFEPRATRLFSLRVKTKDPSKLKTGIEGLLTRYHARFDVRAVAQDELDFEVRWPLEQPTDRASAAILALDPGGETAVEWEEKHDKK